MAGKRMSKIAVAAVLNTAVIAAAPPALAHDSVISAQPGVEATVAEFPDTLVLEFSGMPKEDFNTLALSRVEDNEVLFSGEPTVAGREVSIAVPEDVDKQPGHYRIGFQITSSDGHATKGMTTFTFDPEGNLQAQSAAEEHKTNIGGEETTQNSDQVTDRGYNWLWLLLGVILLAGVALAAMGRANTREKADKRIRDLDYNDQQPGNQYSRSGHTGAGETTASQTQGIGTARSDRREDPDGPRTAGPSTDSDNRPRQE